MGLDNGIMIRRKDNLPFGVRHFDNDEWQKEPRCDIEVAYWRKCWGVRAIILDILGVPSEGADEFKMNRCDVLAVIRALKALNKKNWNEGASNFWTWEECKYNHRLNIRRLKRLARIMRKHPDLEVYFYDSY